eukprot:797312-Prorocentrum_minimum.AAC.1
MALPSPVQVCAEVAEKYARPYPPVARTVCMPVTQGIAALAAGGGRKVSCPSWAGGRCHPDGQLGSPVNPATISGGLESLLLNLTRGLVVKRTTKPFRLV